MEPDSPCHDADALRRQLEQPLYNPLLRQWVGRGELDYERYLRTPELLALQRSAAERCTGDELLFQVVHQVQELWLKQLAHEGVELVAELDGDRLWEASARLERMVRVARQLGAELRVLETLPPATFQVIRLELGTGSGQQSPGYNAVHLVGRGLEAALERLLRRHGQELERVYTHRQPPELHRLCEQLMDVDEAWQGWLYGHYQLVRRTLGVAREVKALDGLPTQVLVGRMSQPLLPALWAVRVELSLRWQRERQATPAEAGQP